MMLRCFPKSSKDRFRFFAARLPVLRFVYNIYQQMSTQRMVLPIRLAGREPTAKKT